jgi:hypothetical protein
MMKTLILIWSILFSSLVQAYPVGVQSQNGSATYPALIKVPNSQATKVAGGTLIETGNDNVLVNPSFADSDLTGWTTTSGTTAQTVVATEVPVVGGSALKITPVSNAYDVSQTVTLSTVALKQNVVGFAYKIPATCSGASVKIFVDGGGTAQSTIDNTNKLILDDTYRPIEIPTTVSSATPSIKLNFTAATTCTGDSFFTFTYVRPGIGTQALQLDNVYSGYASSTSGAASNLNIAGWVTCSYGALGRLDCVPRTGIFTATPNCSINIANAAAGAQFSVAYDKANSTSSLIRFWIASGGGASSSFETSFICQKSGSDYANSSSAVYSQSSANYSRRAYTPTFTGFGTVSGVNCFESRSDEFNDIDCTFTSGISTATEARVSLPGSNVSSSSGPTLRTSGTFYKGVTSSTHGGSVLSEVSVGYVTFGDSGTYGGSSINAIAKANGDVIISDGNVFTFSARIPIAGWSNSSSITGKRSD